jgi:hypothetical protein
MVGVWTDHESCVSAFFPKKSIQTSRNDFFAQEDEFVVMMGK